MAKRARSSQKRAFKKSKRRKGGKKFVAKTVNRILSTKVEVEHAQAAWQLIKLKQPRNIPHNNLLVVDNNMVKTTQSIYDPKSPQKCAPAVHA
jgi:hypothetical protein